MICFTMEDKNRKSSENFAFGDWLQQLVYLHAYILYLLANRFQNGVLFCLTVKRSKKLFCSLFFLMPSHNVCLHFNTENNFPCQIKLQFRIG